MPHKSRYSYTIDSFSDVIILTAVYIPAAKALSNIICYTFLSVIEILPGSSFCKINHTAVMIWLTFLFRRRQT